MGYLVATCAGILGDGKPCPKTVKSGKKYCRWHDPDDKSWFDIYTRLASVDQIQKTVLVLKLIEDHPEHKLNLPERDGQKANLRGLDLSMGTLFKRKRETGIKDPPWLKLSGANLDDANLSGADLSWAILPHATIQHAHLENAILSNAQLPFANLSNSFLWFANIKNANLDTAILQGTQFIRADLQGVDFHFADLTKADLSDSHLQGVDLSSAKSISGVHIRGAWFDRTRMLREQLADGIGEEHDGDFSSARQGYLALKQNFDELGDYDASSWAYRKERRMEKYEARERAKTALEKRERRFPQKNDDSPPPLERNIKEAMTGYFKYTSDTLVEWLCDYGESVWRVIGWIALLLLIIGPLIFSGFGGVIWSREASQEYYGLSSWHRFLLWYRVYFLYTLDTFTTASFSGLSPINDTVKLASGLFALMGIALAGLLGFVAGNRIRRS